MKSPIYCRFEYMVATANNERQLLVMQGSCKRRFFKSSHSSGDNVALEIQSCDVTF